MLPMKKVFLAAFVKSELIVTFLKHNRSDCIYVDIYENVRLRACDNRCANI